MPVLFWCLSCHALISSLLTVLSSAPVAMGYASSKLPLLPSICCQAVFGNKNKTFRPKKNFQKGTKLYQLHKYAKVTFSTPCERTRLLTPANSKVDLREKCCNGRRVETKSACTHLMPFTAQQCTNVRQFRFLSTGNTVVTVYTV